MNSPFSRLLKNMQERIGAVVPEIACVDQDRGQLNTKSRPAVQWPCVLIDMETFEYDNLGSNVQTAEGTVCVLLGFAPNGPTASGTPEEYKEAALGYYELEWKLNKALHGWSAGEGFGYLIRKNTRSQQRADGYRVREIRYRLAFDDRSTQAAVTYVAVTPVITGECEAGV